MPDRITRDDLTELERRLAAARPAAGGLDRDRMLFDAGPGLGPRLRRGRGPGHSRPRPRRLVAVGLGIGPRPRAVPRPSAWSRARSPFAGSTARPAHTLAPLAPSRAIEVAPDSYLVLSHRALAGLDDLPAPGRRLDGLVPPAPERLLSPRGLRDLESRRAGASRPNPPRIIG